MTGVEVFEPLPGGLPPAPMASRRSQLRLIQPEDYDFLYRLAIDAGRSWSWRGRPISSESFLATLWENVESQFLICSSNGERLGLASTLATYFIGSATFGCISHHMRVARAGRSKEPRSF